MNRRRMTMRTVSKEQSAIIADPPNGGDGGGASGSSALSVRVRVENIAGEPIEGLTVTLSDRQGGIARGITGSNGEVVLRENVGSPPCNEIDVWAEGSVDGERLTIEKTKRNIGCFNGGESTSVTIQVDTEIDREEMEEKEQKQGINTTLLVAGGATLVGGAYYASTLSGEDRR